MKRLITALTIAALAVPAAAQTYETMPKGNAGGGHSGTFMKRIQSWNADGRCMALNGHKTRANQIWSAGTFYLSLDCVCVGADTRFHFHGPSANVTAVLPPIPGMHLMNSVRRAGTIDEMADLYDTNSPGLGQWFKTNAAHKTGFQSTKLTGQQLHDTYGYRLCPKM